MGIIFYYVWFGSFHCTWLGLVCGYVIASVVYLVYCVGDCVVAFRSGMVAFVCGVCYLVVMRFAC